MLGGEGYASWGAAEDDVARREAHGDREHRFGGPYEASMGGSAYLIMFVDNASRWMRPYGMNKSETTMYVQKFIADMNNQGRPLCFRTDNGGEFYRGDRLELRRLLRLSRDTPRVHGPG